MRHIYWQSSYFRANVSIDLRPQLPRFVRITTTHINTSIGICTSSYHSGINSSFNLWGFFVIPRGADRQELVQAIKRIHFWHHVQEWNDPLRHSLCIRNICIGSCIVVLVQSFFVSKIDRRSLSDRRRRKI